MQNVGDIPNLTRKSLKVVMLQPLTPFPYSTSYWRNYLLGRKGKIVLQEK